MMGLNAKTLAMIAVSFVAIVPTMTASSPDARASCIGAYREYKEGQREIHRERREMRRAVRNAGSKKEARKEIREGMREMTREKIEQRRGIRRELRPWC